MWNDEKPHFHEYCHIQRWIMLESLLIPSFENMRYAYSMSHAHVHQVYTRYNDASATHKLASWVAGWPGVYETIF